MVANGLELLPADAYRPEEQSDAKGQKEMKLDDLAL